jgi:hypothetical protein
MPNYAKVNLYVGGELKVAKGDPIPDAMDASVAGGDKAANRSLALGLAISDYDALSEADVLDRLPDLTAQQLADVQAYERSLLARESITRYGLEAHAAAELVTNMPATAAAVDADQVLGEAPRAGTVIGVSYVPEAAMTGNTTESRTVRVVNRGQAGAGTTVVATLAFVSGVNGVAFDEKAITLTATLADRAVAAGDVLVWESTHVGSTGLADPGGRVSVKIA